MGHSGKKRRVEVKSSSSFSDAAGGRRDPRHHHTCAGEVDDADWQLSGPKSRQTRANTQIVLVLDKAPMLRTVLAGIVRKLGYQVLETSDVVEAQHLADTYGRIHLLLLDLDTPETGDRQLIQWFRAAHPEIKVLVASSSLWELEFEIAGSQQITVLSKPFTPLELARLVRRVME